MLLTDDDDDDDDDDNDDDDDDEEKNGQDKVRCPKYHRGRFFFFFNFQFHFWFLSTGGGRGWESAVGLGDAGALQDDLPKVVQPKDGCGWGGY